MTMELDKLFEKLGQKKMATIEPAEVSKSDWNNCNIVMHEVSVRAVFTWELKVHVACDALVLKYYLVSSVYKQHDSLAHAVSSALHTGFVCFFSSYYCFTELSVPFDWQEWLLSLVFG